MQQRQTGCEEPGGARALVDASASTLAGAPMNTRTFAILGEATGSDPTTWSELARDPSDSDLREMEPWRGRGDFHRDLVEFYIDRWLRYANVRLGFMWNRRGPQIVLGGGVACSGPWRWSWPSASRAPSEWSSIRVVGVPSRRARGPENALTVRTAGATMSLSGTRRGTIGHESARGVYRGDGEQRDRRVSPCGEGGGPPPGGGWTWPDAPPPQRRWRLSFLGAALLTLGLHATLVVFSRTPPDA
jgi:hypothetical protein